jgi:type IV pilus assembly protein PilW
LKTSGKRQSGISLIELLIAVALGLFIAGALTYVFVDSSRSFRDLRRSGEQIENGRFALSLLVDDLRHAGYFGQLNTFPALAAIDPCVTPTLAHLAAPIEVVSAATLAATAASPGGCLPASEIAPGSDVLVIRRVDTNLLVADPTPAAPNPTGVSVSNAVYLQANPLEGEIQLGNGGTIDRTMKANGDAATILRRDGNAAPIRRLHVSFYYVSPCSQQTCGSGGDGVRTLKRMDLATGGGSPTWTVFPLVSGIEFMQVDLGVDTLPNVAATATGLIGDGTADGTFLQTTAAWDGVVSVRVYLLARSLEPTVGHADTKTYRLGLATAGSEYGPTNDAFKRKVFAGEIRLNNPGGRRERIAGEYL